MTNATLGANARALPEATNHRARAQSTKVIEREAVKLADGNDHFERLYCQWLYARASYFEPGQDDDGIRVRCAACDEAGRQLLIAPVSIDHMLWKKWEVLEFYVGEDAIDGKANDNRAVMALGCIKADLISLGIGDGSQAA